MGGIQEEEKCAKDHLNNFDLRGEDTILQGNSKGFSKKGLKGFFWIKGLEDSGFEFDIFLDTYKF